MTYEYTHAYIRTLLVLNTLMWGPLRLTLISERHKVAVMSIIQTAIRPIVKGKID